jgi:hypothetical protein
MPALILPGIAILVVTGKLAAIHALNAKYVKT